MEKEFPIHRKAEIEYLNLFKNAPTSGFLYVRGRRRVGKSWLLKKFTHNNKKNCFYFSGVADFNTKDCIVRFIQEWEHFLGTTKLSRYKTEEQNWDRIFDEIYLYAKSIKRNNKKFIVIFDEIQWIAKERSGFASILKQAWLNLEQVQNIKIIVCGSSNKFFHQKTGGEETILRGLQTHATLWVLPVTLAEVKKFVLPTWSLEDICLTYMMLGGIPYYLKQIEQSLHFVHALNKALFINSTIFLSEIDEILRLEFNTAGLTSVKKVLSHLGQTGTTHAILVQKTGFHLSRITEILEKLQEYNIVFEKQIAHSTTKKNKSGVLFYLKDFYLNFYFQLSQPLQEQIKNNKQGLLFPYTALQGKQGYYIENFSGKAFELLVRHVLEDKRHRSAGIFKKLLLLDENYTLENWWSKTSEIDLLVEHKKDKISRIVECKWAFTEQKTWITDLLSKQYTPPKGFKTLHILVTSCPWNANFAQLAKKSGVVLVGLEDLF